MVLGRKNQKREQPFPGHPTGADIIHGTEELVLQLNLTKQSHIKSGGLINYKG